MPTIWDRLTDFSFYGEILQVQGGPFVVQHNVV